MMQLRRLAWILVFIVDVGYIAWGAAAAAGPEQLLGPGGKAILPAGYEGFSGASWSQLVGAAPLNAAFMALLFRMYGVYNVLFGFLSSIIAITAFRRGERWAWWALFIGNTVALVSAMTYDKMVHAIGPFEVTEYIGLALVWCAMAMTVPLRAASRAIPSTN